MKGIEKKKHEHLLQSLEELRLHTSDPDKGREVEAEIATLTEIYERYLIYTRCRIASRPQQLPLQGYSTGYL